MTITFRQLISKGHTVDLGDLRRLVRDRIYQVGDIVSRAEAERVFTTSGEQWLLSPSIGINPYVST